MEMAQIQLKLQFFARVISEDIIKYIFTMHLCVCVNFVYLHIILIAHFDRITGKRTGVEF